MPVLVPGVWGQAVKSVSCFPVTWSAAWPKRNVASSFHAAMEPERSI